MADRTAQGRHVTEEITQRRKARQKKRDIRALEYQTAQMREFQIPDKEDELLALRADLEANEQRLADLLNTEESDG